jgi:hypothetical protein
LRPWICYQFYFTVGSSEKIADNVRAPIAITDYAEFDGLHGMFVSGVPGYESIQHSFVSQSVA